MALIRDFLDRLLFPDREQHGIPALDGPFSPNSYLDQARPLGASIELPDDFVAGADGCLYVSSGHQVLCCTGADFEHRARFAAFSAPVSALACTPDGQLLVGVSGQGLVALSGSGAVTGRLSEVAGTPLACPTAITAGADGRIWLCDGSRHHRPEDWQTDLMAGHAPSGRLVCCDANLGNARVLADGLAWPSGVALAQDDETLLVAEAWGHRLLTYSAAGGPARVVAPNLAGYPARLTRDPAGGYWMAFFGLRTQLIEFVLREHTFRAAMMAQVPRPLWIGPNRDGHFDYRESEQIGRIRKLGIQKPWAPPRSYGLVARLDDQGTARQSLHSRVDGQVHGITAVCRVGSRVLAIARFHGLLVALPALSAQPLKVK